jgi:outer membrane protein OmpA-like peptidoglycan-associated protein
MRAVMATGGAVLVAAITAAIPAQAQTAQPSAYDYVCKLTPEACIDGNTPTDAKVRTNDRSFSLALANQPKPTAQPGIQARPRADQRVRTNYTAPATQPAPAAGRVRRASLGVSAGDMMMTFLNGSSELTPQARTNAAVLAKVMNSGLAASKRFVIEGHTNAVGSSESNYKLSQQRADALKAFLVNSGVDGSRLEAKGYGFDRTLPGRSKMAPENRRVEAKAIS